MKIPPWLALPALLFCLIESSPCDDLKSYEWPGFKGNDQDVSLMMDLGKDRMEPSGSQTITFPYTWAQGTPPKGILISGYYTPSVSGRHNFYVNGGQLWVSSSESPSDFDIEPTAFGRGKDHSDFTSRDTLRGKTLGLETGKRYYFEIRAASSGSEGWVNLAVQSPGATAPAPIPASAFSQAPARDFTPLPASRRDAVRVEWWDRARPLPGDPIAAPEGVNNFWYRQPALHWTQAVPLGNGRIGAMHFGGVADDRLQLNEDTIWGGGPANANNPAAASALPQIRQLLFDNKNKEASDMALKSIQGTSPIGSYQTLGELYIDAPGIEDYGDYRRSLDLSTGISTVVFTSKGVHHRREYFVSRPANALVSQWSADKPGQISMNLRLFRSTGAKSYPDPSNPHAILLEGRAGGPKARLAYVARLEAVAEGGEVANTGGILSVKGADKVKFLLTVGTNYKDEKADPTAIAAAAMKKVIPTGYDALRRDHVSDFRSLFDRVSIDLGNNPSWAKCPTDERIKHFREMMARKKGGDGKDDVSSPIRYPQSEDDPGLFALVFQFGRYLLISSSRPGSLPANLQGIWAWKPTNIWNSDFHVNINLQMNYWPSCVTGLEETQLPLLDFMESLVEPGKISARSMYGASGWMMHHNTDAWGRTAPSDRMAGLWPMGAIWMSFHAWEQYAYTQNLDLLRQRSYPLMKGAAEFAMDYMIEAPAGTSVAGKLVSSPSYSPENAFRLPSGETASYTYGATMDQMLIRQLLQDCIRASEILGTDDKFRERCRQTIARMAPTRISPKDGRIMEWIEDYEDVEPHHRHTSHLVGLFPGDEINPHVTPELAAGARKVLEARGYGGTGWSLAWKACFYARLNDGDLARCMIATIIGKNLCPNGFDDIYGGNKVFQIDANFGATAAIAEMLLQSHEMAGSGSWIIDLLPALPPEWKNGSVTGLRARGGVIVDIEWKEGKLVRAGLTAAKDGTYTLRYGGKILKLDLKASKRANLQPASFR